MDDNYYMCFTAGFPEDMARKLFIKKHNMQPNKVFIEKGVLKVGPEPKRKVMLCDTTNNRTQD